MKYILKQPYSYNPISRARARKLQAAGYVAPAFEFAFFNFLNF